MKLFLLVIFSAFCVPLLAQDVTGIWRGYFNQVVYSRDAAGNKVASNRERYKFEVQLDQRNNKFNGVTYSYLSTVFYGKASAAGTVNLKTKKVLLDELKIVEVRMSGLSDACVMTCFLQYSKSGDEEFLEGTYTSMNVRDSSNCGRGTVFLRRVVTSDFYKEPFLVKREKDREDSIALARTRKPPTSTAKTNTTTTKPGTTPAKSNPIKSNSTAKTNTAPKNPASAANNTNKTADVTKPPVDKTPTPKSTDIRIAKVDTVKKVERKLPSGPVPKVLTTRDNEVVKTIYTKSNEISIDIYDNGTIDNDTVSVYLDKKLVISKQRLTGKAINFKFQLDNDNDYHELIMVADNLGEIPPNTSLMVVRAGEQRYEVRITSNEQKNAVVIFKFEKDR